MDATTLASAIPAQLPRDLLRGWRAQSGRASQRRIVAPLVGSNPLEVGQHRGPNVSMRLSGMALALAIGSLAGWSCGGDYDRTPPTENTLESCRDGVDNDADDFVDCEDQDCQIYVVCVPADRAEGGSAGAPEVTEPSGAAGAAGETSQGGVSSQSGGSGDAGATNRGGGLNAGGGGSSVGGRDPTGGSPSAGGGDAQGGLAGNGGSGQSGNDETAGSGNTEFTAADCPAAAAVEEPGTCSACLYEKLCDAVVPCENRSGCMDAIDAMTFCIYVKYEENAAGGDEGFVTDLDIDDCAIEANMGSSGDANDLWAAIANHDEWATTDCRFECYLD